MDRFLIRRCSRRLMLLSWQLVIHKGALIMDIGGGGMGDVIGRFR